MSSKLPALRKPRFRMTFFKPASSGQAPGPCNSEQANDNPKSTENHNDNTSTETVSSTNPPDTTELIFSPPPPDTPNYDYEDSQINTNDNATCGNSGTNSLGNNADEVFLPTQPTPTESNEDAPTLNSQQFTIEINTNEIQAALVCNRETTENCENLNNTNHHSDNNNLSSHNNPQDDATTANNPTCDANNDTTLVFISQTSTLSFQTEIDEPEANTEQPNNTTNPTEHRKLILAGKGNEPTTLNATNCYSQNASADTPTATPRPTDICTQRAPNPQSPPADCETEICEHQTCDENLHDDHEIMEHSGQTSAAEENDIMKNTLEFYGCQVDSMYSSTPPQNSSFHSNSPSTSNPTLERIISHIIHNGKARFQYKWKGIMVTTTGSEKTALENRIQLFSYLKSLKGESSRKYNHLLRRFSTHPLIKEFASGAAEKTPKHCKCVSKLLRLQNTIHPRPTEIRRAKKRITQTLEHANIEQSDKESIMQIIEESCDRILKNEMYLKNGVHDKQKCEKIKLATSIISNISKQDKQPASTAPAALGKIVDHVNKRGKLVFITLGKQRIQLESALRDTPNELKEYLEELALISPRKFNHLINTQPATLILFPENPAN